MAKIEFSAGLMSGLPGRIMRAGENLYIWSNPWQSSAGLMLGGSDSSNYPTAKIYLMKGTVPTDANAVTNFSTRSADLLVEYRYQDNVFAGSQFATNPVVVNSTYVNATNTGTATWFWWTLRERYWFADQNVIYHQIIGTVGTPGSGSDMEIPSTSIVAGQPYRFTNLKIQFPSSWTF